MDTDGIETCLVCGKQSAYCWDDCDIDEGGQIAHIGACSFWEWECGHCRAHHVQADSPILAECYTHHDYSAD